jgi:hypothetical protein
VCIGASLIFRGVSSLEHTVKNEKGDLVADSYSILAGWRSYFSQLLNKQGFNNVRQIELHTEKPIVPVRLSWLLKS